eukprot:TRINITY_DN15638_c0_g1_i1.p1 TRINITY_DN15638_c0_g1~~TRINITY_DN15638_c0_g1_i1.p1  ORF type:complete len:405 (+),score=92.47 TRINITY_DN15638_c0_g1_i1:26-1216(+)
MYPGYSAPYGGGYAYPGAVPPPYPDPSYGGMAPSMPYADPRAPYGAAPYAGPPPAIPAAYDHLPSYPSASFTPPAHVDSSMPMGSYPNPYTVPPPPNMTHSQHDHGGGSFHYTPPPPGAAAMGPPPVPPVPSVMPSAANPPAKKAFLCGINYINTPQSKLSGCINDTKFMQHLLISKFGYPATNILMMNDESHDPSLLPTRYNLMAGVQWLVAGAKPGDHLFFHFSGHGGQTRDLDGDEADGMDETILPMDYKTAGSIVDDELHRYLAMQIPPGCRLTVLMDCCHSGTGIDLPYVYGRRTATYDPINPAKVTQGTVISLSGCMDHQTSADTNRLAQVASTGVLTYTFCQTMERHYPHLTYSTLLSTMQQFTREKSYEQVILLSSGTPLDLNQPFIV